MVNGQIQFCAAAILFFGALISGGCATSASAPFHMYSSPLLEGDSSSPDPGFPATSRGGHPGVAPRQIYTYHRWRLEPGSTNPNRQLRPGNKKRPIYDTVEPLDRPVLANYPTRSATGAGSTRDGGAPDSESTTQELIAANPPQEYTADPLTESHRAAQYIDAVLQANQVDLNLESAATIPELYRACRAQGEVYHSNRPNIGDIVFFHNTDDLNQDGRNNDWYTLVGIIEGVRINGTIDLLAFHQGQVRRLHLNLDEPNTHSASDGAILNSRLRPERSKDAPFTQYLSGQLFAGFCNILGDRPELVVIDHWAPLTED